MLVRDCAKESDIMCCVASWTMKVMERNISQRYKNVVNPSTVNVNSIHVLANARGVIMIRGILAAMVKFV